MSTCKQTPAGNRESRSNISLEKTPPFLMKEMATPKCSVQIPPFDSKICHFEFTKKFFFFIFLFKKKVENLYTGVIIIARRENIYDAIGINQNINNQTLILIYLRYIF